MKNCYVVCRTCRFKPENPLQTSSESASLIRQNAASLNQPRKSFANLFRISKFDTSERCKIQLASKIFCKRQENKKIDTSKYDIYKYQKYRNP